MRLVHSVHACLPMCGPFQPSLLPVQLCWCLFIDVVCLSDDGCLFDAVVLAVEVALRKRKRHTESCRVVWLLDLPHNAAATVMYYFVYATHSLWWSPVPAVLLPTVQVQEETGTPVVQTTPSQPLPINCLVAAATVASMDQLVEPRQQFLLSM